MMERTSIERDKTYTLFELADRTGMRVSELQDLVNRGHLNSHYTDDMEVVNGKDFLQWAQSHRGGERRHYE
jgi:hypothetical protein